MKSGGRLRKNRTIPAQQGRLLSRSSAPAMRNAVPRDSVKNGGGTPSHLGNCAAQLKKT